jgi:oxygen-independent coproporphyrinogen-3 oxidase
MVRPFRSLYVHVPFCAAKCDYCAFYSVPDSTPELRQAYLQRLAEEMASYAPRCGELVSVYVGGGTPSYLRAAELDALLESVHRHFRVPRTAEFTVECNPESLTAKKAAALAGHGVNRVSLGVQSFDAELRRTIGRHGGPERLGQSLAALRTAGIHNVGIDLIYAIPGQTLDGWRSDLLQACATGACHLSTYELTFEEGARLGRGTMAPADEDLAAEMWQKAAEVTAAAGFRRYEVSNLSRIGFECLHNQEVWHGGTYLGCGPAASSFDGEVRWTNPADIDRWLKGFQPEADRLRPAERAAEILAIGLRTTRGWEREEFRDRTGADHMDLRGAILQELAEEGLLRITADTIAPTERGLLFADHVGRRLL